MNYIDKREEKEERERSIGRKSVLALAFQRDERVRSRAGHLGRERPGRVGPEKRKGLQERRSRVVEKPEEAPDLILGLGELPAQ